MRAVLCSPCFSVFFLVFFWVYSNISFKYLSEKPNVLIAAFYGYLLNAVIAVFKQFFGCLYPYALQIFQRRIAGSPLKTADKIPVAHIVPSG